MFVSPPSPSFPSALGVPLQLPLPSPYHTCSILNIGSLLYQSVLERLSCTLNISRRLYKILSYHLLPNGYLMSTDAILAAVAFRIYCRSDYTLGSRQVSFSSSTC